MNETAAVMPPFGKESSEASEKRLPFLSLGRHAAPKAAGKPSGAFGAEKAESSCGSRAPKRVKSENPSGNFIPFQDEDDESSQPPQKNPKAFCPFGDEPDEDEEQSASEQSGAEESFELTSSSVFALGWQSILSFKQATFWKANQDDHTGSKPKRTYDNSKRKANALYIKKDTGSFKKNGSDPQRLAALFKQPACRCATAC